MPTIGEGGLIPPISGQSIVIGGTSLTGGVGSVANTLVGTLIIGVMNNGLAMGVSSYYQQIVKGAIIVLAVMIDHSRRKNP